MLADILFAQELQDKTGPNHKTHVLMSDGELFATDGVISYCCPVDASIHAGLHTYTLAETLKKTGDDYQIIHESQDHFIIRSGKFRVKMQPLDPDLLVKIPLYGSKIDINEEVLDKLQNIESMASKKGELVITSSMLLTQNTALTSNRRHIIETYHGLGLDNRYVVPIQLFATIKKLEKICGKKPIAMHENDKVLFLSYEDKSYLACQLFDCDWPDLSNIFSTPSNVQAIPEELSEAIDYLEPFSENGTLNFEQNLVQTTGQNQTNTASFETKNCQLSGLFKVDDLRFMIRRASHYDPVGNDKSIYYYGDDVRGAIARFN